MKDDGENWTGIYHWELLGPMSAKDNKNNNNPVPTNVVDSNPSDPLASQVGGSHYKNCGIQPVEYMFANNMDYLEGAVVKYITRYKQRNGVEDLDKAIHFIQLIKKLRYGV